MKIIETFGGDISTIFAYLNQEAIDALPDPGVGRYGKIEKRKVDTWSCFNGTYQRGQEREFIAKVESENPGKYSYYKISWSDCN